MASWSERIAVELVANRRFRVIGTRKQPPDMEGAVELYVECHSYDSERALRVARTFTKQREGMVRVVQRLERVPTIGLLITSRPRASDEQTLVASAHQLFLRLLADSRAADRGRNRSLRRRAVGSAL